MWEQVGYIIPGAHRNAGTSHLPSRCLNDPSRLRSFPRDNGSSCRNTSGKLLVQQVILFHSISVRINDPDSQELGHQVSLIRSVAERVFSEMGTELKYKVGTMIEIPRAALVADEVRSEQQ